MSPVDDIARCLSGASDGWRQGVARARRYGIVKITADVYAFMLSYCRWGFTDVYADLRFVLSAGTHCPRNYYSAVAAALQRPRARGPSPFSASIHLKFRISYALQKILCPFLL